MHAKDSYIGALLPTYGGRTSDQVVRYVMTVMGLNILPVASLAHRLQACCCRYAVVAWSNKLAGLHEPAHHRLVAATDTGDSFL